jgi:hypothetical protein
MLHIGKDLQAEFPSGALIVKSPNQHPNNPAILAARAY